MYNSWFVFSKSRWLLNEKEKEQYRSAFRNRVAESKQNDDDDDSVFNSSHEDTRLRLHVHRHSLGPKNPFGVEQPHPAFRNPTSPRATHASRRSNRKPRARLRVPPRALAAHARLRVSPVPYSARFGFPSDTSPRRRDLCLDVLRARQNRTTYLGDRVFKIGRLDAGLF